MIFQEPMTSLNPVLTIGRQIGERVLRRHQGLSKKKEGARVPSEHASTSWASRPPPSASTSTRTSCPAACGGAR